VSRGSVRCAETESAPPPGGCPRRRGGRSLPGRAVRSGRARRAVALRVPRAVQHEVSRDARAGTREASSTSDFPQVFHRRSSRACSSRASAIHWPEGTSRASARPAGKPTGSPSTSTRRRTSVCATSGRPSAASSASFTVVPNSTIRPARATPTGRGPNTPGRPSTSCPIRPKSPAPCSTTPPRWNRSRRRPRDRRTS